MSSVEVSYEIEWLHVWWTVDIESFWTEGYAGQIPKGGLELAFSKKVSFWKFYIFHQNFPKELISNFTTMIV